jgi:hypothetical protein
VHELAEISDGCQQSNVNSCQSFVYYLAYNRVGRHKPNVSSEFIQQLKYTHVQNIVEALLTALIFWEGTNQNEY